MQCQQCKALIENSATFCGNCGTKVDMQTAGEATVIETPLEENLASHGQAFAQRGYESQRPLSPPRPSGQPGTPALFRGSPSGPSDAGERSTPSPFPPVRPAVSPRTRILLMGIILLLLFAGIAAGITLLSKRSAPSAPAAVNTKSSPGSISPVKVSGTVSFNDSPGSQGLTDALKITATGLSAPPAGSRYTAWLVNESTEQTLSLGTLSAEGQIFSLNVANTGKNLLGAGNKVEITLEQGTVTLPTGTVMLTGTFPPKAFVHIRHLLYSFPVTPGNVGLLVGLRNQVQLLGAQTLLLQSFAANQNKYAITCAAQSIVDIIEGAKGPHAQPLPAGCASVNITAVGDGFGLLGTNSGYITDAAIHASLAATQSDSTPNIKLHAGHVEIAMTNVKGWITTIDQDALSLLANPGETTNVQQINTLANQSLNGVDTNGDERVDPVPGEAGTLLAYNHAQLMATLPLAAA